MYRQHILKQLERFFSRDEDLTVGQILLSILNSREDTYRSKSDWLMNTSDEDLYTAIQNAMEREEEVKLDLNE